MNSSGQQLLRAAAAGQNLPIVTMIVSKTAKGLRVKAEQASQTRDWAKLNKMGLYENISCEDEDAYDDSYRKLDEDFRDFVAERVSVPPAELPFDGKEYSWATNPFLNGLRQAQRRYLVKSFKKHNRTLYYLSIVSTMLIYIEAILPLALANYWNLGTSIPLMDKVLCFFASFFILWFSGMRLRRKIETRIFNAEEKSQENYEFAMRWDSVRQAFNDLKYPQQWADRRYDTDFHVEFGPFGKRVTSLDGTENYKWKNAGKDKFIIADDSGKEAPLRPEISPKGKG